MVFNESGRHSRLKANPRFDFPLLWSWRPPVEDWTFRLKIATVQSWLNVWTKLSASGKSSRELGRRLTDVANTKLNVDVAATIEPDEVGTIDVYDAQLLLRAELLDKANINQSGARDLAAHMLLHLDDISGCWNIATNWLRFELGCQRVDTGFGRAQDLEYTPGFSEARNPDYDVPSFGGEALENRDPFMQLLWSNTRPLVFDDIKQDRRATPKLRRKISSARTKSKFASPLRTSEGAYGLICADWTEHFVPNESALFDCFEQTVSDVLSPIIAVAKKIRDAKEITGSNGGGTIGHASYIPPVEQPQVKLTASEAEVARLVAQGFSYKEIARIRDRSSSTVDHQLRSLRKKFGVSSTASLVSLLARSDRFSN